MHYASKDASTYISQIIIQGSKRDAEVEWSKEPNLQTILDYIKNVWYGLACIFSITIMLRS